ncbi:MAG: flagellar filament capping protein FliD [Selenomonadaceae bacterium]|nr:flagellar filament capping protein FliD [Selenomonadaceae bacterium]MDY2685110.1 flagellar filament capping protein FliD [Selenomonadaceae bacterium]
MSVTRGIYGLSGSGIDVDSMVKVGMMTYQNRYDKMYKQEVKNEWMKEAYTDVYNNLNTFNTSTLSSYKMTSKTSPMLASSSNTTAVTAVANADAATMSHTVTVSKLASNAYMLTGSEKLKRENTDSSASKSVKLKDILFSAAQQKDLADRLAAGTLKDTDTIASFKIADGTQPDSNSAEISFTYADLFSSDQTMNDFASKINASGVNIRASYDATNDAFSLYQKDGGSKNQIILSASSDTTNNAQQNGLTLLNNLNLHQVVQTQDAQTGAMTSSLSTDAFTVSADKQADAAGETGQVVIDGKPYESDTGRVTAGGVTYTLNAIGSTTVSVSQDTDTLVKNVQAFVDDYNKMFDKLTEKYYETQYSDYDVLTKSQENAMTSDQVTKWNEKAKSGLLYHDQTLSKIISAMREAIATPVDSSTSSYNSMMSIGITSSTDQGHLTLDTDKLKKALAADPDCVRNIFAASGDVTTTKNGVTKTTTDYDSEGVLNRISDSLYTNLKTLKSYAGNSTETSDGSTLGTLIETLKTKMSDFQVQMDAYEEQLYDKYDAMETAIQQLSVQLGYISGSSS